MKRRDGDTILLTQSQHTMTFVMQVSSDTYRIYYRVVKLFN